MGETTKRSAGHTPRAGRDEGRGGAWRGGRGGAGGAGRAELPERVLRTSLLGCLPRPTSRSQQAAARWFNGGKSTRAGASGAGPSTRKPARTPAQQISTRPWRASDGGGGRAERRGAGEGERGGGWGGGTTPGWGTKTQLE